MKTVLSFLARMCSFFVPKLSKMDMQRVLAMVVLVGVCFYDDPTTLNILKFVFGFLIAIALISHIVRKVLVPYADMGVAYREAVKTPLGAGLVWLGLCLILVTTIYVSGQFFNK